MKIPFTLILCIITFSSCKNIKGIDNQIDENGNQIVYDEVTWFKLWEKDSDIKVKVIDTSCINQRNRAKKDISNGMLTYFYMGRIKYRSNIEMNELLAKYNIGVDSTLTTSIAPPPGFEYYCYENEMMTAIETQFGKKFIDSLRSKAEKKYVLKYPDKIYEFHDCDTIARYPRASNYREHFDNYKIDYFKNFKYPEGYKFKNEKYYSYTTAEFILYKDGSISDIVIETTFQNPSNEKYRELFDSKMAEFIKKTEWIPAKSAGIIVNSKMPIYVSYE